MPSNPHTNFYELALGLSSRALEAGALPEALMWAQQAELIAAEVTQHPDQSQITEAYAHIMLESCLRSQELALNTGNLLPEHGELADIISITSEHLANQAQRAGSPPRAAALVAQGYARMHRLRFTPSKLASEPIVVPTGSIGPGPVIRPHDKRLYGAEKAEDLEKMLQNLAEIERCAVILCGPNPPTIPFERKLTTAKAALSNARHSLVRLFSSTFSDWPMAKFFCKNAYTLLTAKPISEAPGTLNNPELDCAVKQLPDAYKALESHNYKESARHLDSALDRLEQAASES
jgi:hypothetical protein